MRIDNRRVNGRITFEKEDTIQQFAIVVNPAGGIWAAGVDKTKNIIKIPNSVAGAAIIAKLEKFDLVLITVINMINVQGTIKVLPFPSYDYNRSTGILSIDIGEIIPGTTMEITLPSGAITVKENQ